MSQPLKTPTQPKIAQRLALRTLFLVIVLGGCYFFYNFWKDKSQDLDSLRPADTTGWMSAIQFQDDGQQAVAISPAGKLVPSTGWTAGRTDRDLIWSPSGNRVFFVSDREDNNYNVFRWNPTNSSDPARRTVGSRSASLPQFPREQMEDADASALITSGGFVLEYAPKDMSTRQVLPQQGKEVVQSQDEEGGGSSDQFSGTYDKLGTAFKVAKWCKGKNWIAAIMLRDEGEILVLQKMQPNAEGRLPRPEPVAAGDHVQFDVNPKDGSIVFAVQNFQWPDPAAVPAEFRKGNKVSRPFAHVLGRIDPDAANHDLPIAASPNDKVAFGSPTISPDGASVLFVAGDYKDGAIHPKALVTCPDTPEGSRGATSLLQGEVYEPCWSPDGLTIAFAQRQPSGKRSLIKINKDGSGFVNLTGDSGNFGFPLFSPQVKG